MPTAKSKKKKPKKETFDAEEPGEGERRRLQLRTVFCSLLLGFNVVCSSTVGVEVEMEEVTNRSHSVSRDPLTPEPHDPAPQKKKKKKRAFTIGQNNASLLLLVFLRYLTVVTVGIKCSHDKFRGS